MANYSKLYEGLKKNSKMALFTHQLFLLRRLLMVIVLCFCELSIHLQVSLMIIINFLATVQVMLVRPFEQLSENLNTGLQEMALAVATIQLPMIAMGKNVSLGGDIIIYTLMGSTILTGIICAVVMVPIMVSLCRKYCSKRPNKVTRVAVI